MVRIPSSSRSEGAAPQDDNRDGRIDERDVSATGARPGTAGPSTYGSATASGPGSSPPPPGSYETTADNAAAAERARAAERATPGGTTYPEAYRPAGQPTAGTYPTGDAGTAAAADSTVGAHRGPAEDVTVVAGPRPRASLLATLSLIAGVAAALFVLSGALAGYGIALGGLALLLAFGGMSATGRRHIAGKSDALFGLILGLGAIALGILAVTDQLAWPTTDADTVQRFREWLDTQLVDRF